MCILPKFLFAREEVSNRKEPSMTSATIVDFKNTITIILAIQEEDFGMLRNYVVISQSPIPHGAAADDLQHD